MVGHPAIPKYPGGCCWRIASWRPYLKEGREGNEGRDRSGPHVSMPNFFHMGSGIWMPVSVPVKCTLLVTGPSLSVTPNLYFCKGFMSPMLPSPCSWGGTLLISPLLPNAGSLVYAVKPGQHHAVVKPGLMKDRHPTKCAPAFSVVSERLWLSKCKLSFRFLHFKLPIFPTFLIWYCSGSYSHPPQLFVIYLNWLFSNWS